MNSFKVLGLMSGNSIDGLDCCLSEISLKEDYSFQYHIIKYDTLEYDIAVKKTINSIISNPFQSQVQNDNTLGLIFAQYAMKFIKHKDLDLVATHGQTIFHQDFKKSIQIGNPRYLYEIYKCPIVYNFRVADIKVGGNGAPLMPFLDWLLFRNLKTNTLTLNIGGISNISIIPKLSLKSSVQGFDCGPGMCLIDLFCSLKFKSNMDLDGKFSRNGKIINKLLLKMINECIIKKNPPKSFSKSQFNIEFLKKYNLINNQEYRNKDILRTLIAYSAKSIAINIKNHIQSKYKINSIILSGGGANHPYLIEDLKVFSKLEIYKINDITKLDINMKESFLIATLGVASIKKLASNMNRVTGSTKEVVLGEIYGN